MSRSKNKASKQSFHAELNCQFQSVIMLSDRDNLEKNDSDLKRMLNLILPRGKTIFEYRDILP